MVPPVRVPRGKERKEPPTLAPRPTTGSPSREPTFPSDIIKLYNNSQGSKRMRRDRTIVYESTGSGTPEVTWTYHSVDAAGSQRWTTDNGRVWAIYAPGAGGKCDTVAPASVVRFEGTLPNGQVQWSSHSRRILAVYPAGTATPPAANATPNAVWKQEKQTDVAKHLSKNPVWTNSDRTVIKIYEKFGMGPLQQSTPILALRWRGEHAGVPVWATLEPADHQQTWYIYPAETAFPAPMHAKANWQWRCQGRDGRAGYLWEAVVAPPRTTVLDAVLPEAQPFFPPLALAVPKGGRLTFHGQVACNVCKRGKPPGPQYFQPSSVCLDEACQTKYQEKLQLQRYG